MSNEPHIGATLGAMYPPSIKPPRGVGLCILCSAWTNFRQFWCHPEFGPRRDRIFYLCSAHPKAPETALAVSNLVSPSNLY